MKLDVYATMYNEEFMIPYFLRHYETFANRIFIFYDKSTDNTRKLLEKHPKVTIFDVERSGIDEGYWISKLWTKYEESSRGRADWVALVDADEFLYHPKLVETLEREKLKGTQLIQPEGFIMLGDKLPTTKGQIYEEVQFGLHDHWATQCCLFDPDIYIRFRPGCHSIAHMQKKIVFRPGSELGIKLLHYRWFGKEYAQARDEKNFKRYFIGKVPPTHQVDPRRQLPDRTRGRLNEWIETHKPDAINVI